jgi:glycosyltransferase involved in cell wall biosynthesis
MTGTSNNRLISICIPTYNRASFLDKTIQSIITQELFSNYLEFELIICNNGSTDHTHEICCKYLELGFRNLFYIKNTETLPPSLNHKKVLNCSKGTFVKLSGDTQIYSINFLSTLQKIVKDNYEKKPLIFFSNCELKSSISGHGINDFIKICSYKITHIPTCGFWKENNILYTNTDELDQLPQVTETLDYLKQKSIFIICNDKIFTNQNINQKSGYDLIDVFLDLYSMKLFKYVSSNHLSKKNYELEQNNIILNFIAPWLARIKIFPNIYKFEAFDFEKRIFFYLKDRIFIFYLFRIKYNLNLVKYFLKFYLDLFKTQYLFK